jgi:transcription initiation factor TFIIIB Brf1 subunit/transcription initiation factor TFIIB
MDDITGFDEIYNVSGASQASNYAGKNPSKHVRDALNLMEITGNQQILTRISEILKIYVTHKKLRVHPSEFFAANLIAAREIGYIVDICCYAANAKMHFSVQGVERSISQILRLLKTKLPPVDELQAIEYFLSKLDLASDTELIRDCQKLLGKIKNGSNIVTQPTVIPCIVAVIGIVLVASGVSSNLKEIIEKCQMEPRKTMIYTKSKAIKKFMETKKEDEPNSE